MKEKSRNIRHTGRGASIKKTSSSIRVAAWCRMCTIRSTTQRRCTSSWRTGSAQISETSRSSAKSLTSVELSRSRSTRATSSSRCSTGTSTRSRPTKKSTKCERPCLTKTKKRLKERNGRNLRKTSPTPSSSPSTKRASKKSATSRMSSKNSLAIRKPWA